MMNLLTEHYQCPDCGATYKSQVVDMCDFCVLKFFTDNPDEPSLELI